MPLFRKKPVTIEAVQYRRGEQPDELAAAVVAGVIRYADDGETVLIRTLEGTMSAVHGDWIIRGVKGELYPCKPDIFAATYEPAPPAPPSGTAPATDAERGRPAGSGDAANGSREEGDMMATNRGPAQIAKAAITIAEGMKGEPLDEEIADLMTDAIWDAFAAGRESVAAKPRGKRTKAPASGDAGNEGGGR